MESHDPEHIYMKKTILNTLYIRFENYNCELLSFKPQTQLKLVDLFRNNDTGEEKVPPYTLKVGIF